MKSSPTPAVLRLVVNKRIAYPKTAADYVMLVKAGVPLKFVYVDFLPLVYVYANKRNFTVETIAFETIEAQAMAKLKAQWPHEIDVDDTTITLKCPKTKEASVLARKVHAALKKFYFNHGMRVQYLIKKHTSTVKVIFKVEPNGGVFVLKDDDGS